MRKSNVPIDRDALRAMGYDPENVPVRTIVIVLGGLLFFLIASIGVGIGVYNWMVPMEYRLYGRGPEQTALRRIPPNPQIQTYPKDEMHQYWAIDHAKLEQYGDLAHLQDAGRDNFGSDAYPGSMKWSGENETMPASTMAVSMATPMPAPTPLPVEHLTGDKGFPAGSDLKSTPAPITPITPIKLATPAPVVATPAPVVATPAPAVVQAAQTQLTQEMSLKNIEFETAKATIRPTSTTVLDEVSTTLKKVPETPVEIGGYTDSRGKDELNLKLSQDRADAVRDYLIRKGIPAKQLTAKGYGKANPIADNATPEGQQKNRRIEFRLKS